MVLLPNNPLGECTLRKGNWGFDIYFKINVYKWVCISKYLKFNISTGPGYNITKERKYLKGIIY